MNPTSFITWVCVIVFTAIAFITILSIVNVVTINESYQKKLFYTLIIEVAVTGVLVFKNFVTNTTVTKDYNIVRIMYPGPGDTTVDLRQNEPLHIWGVCRKQQDAYVSGYLRSGEKKYPIINSDLVINTKDVFFIDYKLADSALHPTLLNIYLYIVSNTDTISRDSIYFTLKMK